MSTYSMPAPWRGMSRAPGLGQMVKAPSAFPGTLQHRIAAGSRAPADASGLVQQATAPQQLAAAAPMVAPMQMTAARMLPGMNGSDAVPTTQTPTVTPMAGTTAQTPAPVAPAPWALPTAPTFDPTASWMDPTYQSDVLTHFYDTSNSTAAQRAELDRLGSAAGQSQYQGLLDQLTQQQAHEQYAQNADFARAGIAQGGALATQAALNAPAYAAQLAKLDLESGTNVNDAGSHAYDLAQQIQRAYQADSYYRLGLAPGAHGRDSERKATATAQQQADAQAAATSAQAAALQAAGLAVPAPSTTPSPTSSHTTMPQAPGVQKYAPKGWASGQSGWFKANGAWDFIAADGRINIGVAAPPANLGGHKVWS